MFYCLKYLIVEKQHLCKVNVKRMRMLKLNVELLELKININIQEFSQIITRGKIVIFKTSKFYN